jgi:hypothetical protein
MVKLLTAMTRQIAVKAIASLTEIRRLLSHDIQDPIQMLRPRSVRIGKISQNFPTLLTSLKKSSNILSENRSELRLSRALPEPIRQNA